MDFLTKNWEINEGDALDQTDYQCRYDALIALCEDTRQRLAEIDVQINGRRVKCENIEAFMRTLRAQECLLIKFDEGLWNTTIECLTAHSATEFTFKFKDGTELKWIKK